MIIGILFGIFTLSFLSFLIIWKLAFNYRGKIKLNLKTFKRASIKSIQRNGDMMTIIGMMTAAILFMMVDV